MILDFLKPVTCLHPFIFEVEDHLENTKIKKAVRKKEWIAAAIEIIFCGSEETLATEVGEIFRFDKDGWLSLVWNLKINP